MKIIAFVVAMFSFSALTMSIMDKDWHLAGWQFTSCTFSLLYLFFGEELLS
jgi:hypothetical protein